MNRIRSCLAGLLLVAGCSEKKPETATPAAPTPPQSPAVVTTNPAPRAVKVAVDKLEQDYVRAQDLYTKLVVLEQLPDAEPAGAVSMLGRLFQHEEDIEMREELVYSLNDIGGEVQAKLDFLLIALQPDQPESVRLAAIDSFVELRSPDAVPILQNFFNDPSQIMRDAIADAVEQLKSDE